MTQTTTLGFASRIRKGWKLPGPNDKRNLHRQFKGKSKGTQLLGETRRAWMSVKNFMAIMYFDTRQPEVDAVEGGNEVRIILRDGPTQIKLNLTSWREDELTAFRRFMDMSCANALEVVRERDRVAFTALDEGSTKYPRCFRQQAQLLVREGDEFDHPTLKRVWPGASGENLEQQAHRFSTAPIGVFVSREEMIGGTRDEGEEAQE